MKKVFTAIFSYTLVFRILWETFLGDALLGLI